MDNYAKKLKRFAIYFTISIVLLYAFHTLLVVVNVLDDHLLSLGYVYFYVLIPAIVLLWFITFLNLKMNSEKTYEDRFKLGILNIFIAWTGVILVVQITTNFIGIEGFPGLILLSIHFVSFLLLNLIFSLKKAVYNLYYLNRAYYIFLFCYLIYLYAFEIINP